ncbi:M23 family metallopeptidase [Paenisporosarcina sp. TG-14]|uniref:M23 family metallopeptidase n=1 Tax=Paenisporosarcina sp. TG-14 TaxID=1231057 RepID=UPI00031CA0D9|nr:M23 family metallopeptidase [Paenisporosarcina sp. TG-14]
MREEKSNNPSLVKIKSKKNKWLWPSIYVGFSLLFVGMIWGYNAFVSPESDVADSGLVINPNGEEAKVPVTAQAENMKFPFDEAMLDQMTILQDFYDTEASEESQENSLLVFNQTYETNSGVSISIEGQPFEVVSAMSGTVKEVNLDPFIGDEIIVEHENGYLTVYRSVTEILVKTGDVVKQGQAMATSTENEFNPTAGIHLQFEVFDDKGEVMNPRTYLAF